MPRKPNYNFERHERERIKAAKKAEREKIKAERRAAHKAAGAPPPGDAAEAESPANDEPRDS